MYCGVHARFNKPRSEIEFYLGCWHSPKHFKKQKFNALLRRPGPINNTLRPYMTRQNDNSYLQFVRLYHLDQARIALRGQVASLRGSWCLRWAAYARCARQSANE